MMSFSQQFNNVRGRGRVAVPGQLLESGAYPFQLGHGVNADPQAVQVTTVAVSGASDGIAYTLTVNGSEISIISATSSTTTTIAAQLVEAINADPIARGACIASNSGATISLTGLWPGQSFTVTESDSNLGTPSTTSAADAAAIEFGTAVVSDGFDSGEFPNMKLVKKAAEGAFSAQVLTLTVTYVASAVVSSRVYEVRGSERILLAEAETTMATDRDTSLEAIATALNAKLAANTVLVAAAPATATGLTFTAEIAGLEIDAEIVHISGGSGQVAVTRDETTGPSPATSLHRAFQGVAKFGYADEAATVGASSGSYPANAGVQFVKKGLVGVESDETPAAGGTVYVELGSSNTGKFFAASGADRVALSRQVAQWERDISPATDSVAALRLL